MSAGVSIQRISFRSSLPILLGQQPVRAPQWIRGVRALPVAFAGPGDWLPVRAKFSCTTPFGLVRIRARRVGGTLPSVDAPDEKEVDFAGGTAATADFNVRVADSRVNIGSVTWQWEFEEGGEWRDAGTSDHEIAITLARPTAPWNETRLWFEVLRHSCAAAAGSATIEEAATRMTNHTFAGFNSNAYHWTGDSNYATNDDDEPRAFDCAMFLRLLSGEALPDRVDCADLSAVLSTFANSLGCNLNQIAIGRTMKLNPVLKANLKKWGARLDEFGTHEFTFIGTGSKLIIWDGCVTVSSASAPADPGSQAPVPADVPAAMPLATYLERLLFTDGIPFNERVLIRRRRPIGSLPSEVAAVPPPIEPVIAEGPTPAPPPPSPPVPATWVPQLELSQLSTGPWTLVDQPAVPDQSLPTAVREKVLRLLWRSPEPNARLISCTVYLCGNARQAELRMKVVLNHLRAAGSAEKVPSVAIDGVPQTRFQINRGAIVVGTLLNVAYVVKAARGGVHEEEVASVAEALRARILSSRAPAE
jgi:hypothetical protein